MSVVGDREATSCDNAALVKTDVFDKTILSQWINFRFGEVSIFEIAFICLFRVLRIRVFSTERLNWFFL